MNNFISEYFDSFNSFGSAAIFKEISENDIMGVEKYAREDLPSLLDAALSEANKTYGHKQKSWFFGPFAPMPSKFYVTGGERKLIDRAVQVVKKVVGEPETTAGLEYFGKERFYTMKDKVPYERNMNDTIFGLVFGDEREIQKAEATKNLKQIQKALFARIKPILERFESDEVHALRSFTLDSVKVSLNDTGIPQCSIQCSFCDECRLNDIKIFYKNSGSGSWIFSNLLSHLERCHTTNDSDIFENFEDADNSDVLNPPKIKRIRHARQKQTSNSKKKKANERSESSMTIELQIQPDLPKCAELENAVYFQMKQQIIKMGNCAAKNDDECAETVLDTAKKGSKTSKTIKYCQVFANGDCFFLSISHQVVGFKIGSDQHIQHATELRQKVVHHMKEHFERFKQALKGRVYDKRVTGADDDIDKRCHDFIKTYITKPPIWGGSEAFAALSEILKVNIIVINDNGTCNIPNYFDVKNEKSLLLFFQGWSREKNHNVDRIHYDSIVSLSDIKLKEFAKELSNMEIRHQEFVSNDISHISVD